MGSFPVPDFAWHPRRKLLTSLPESTTSFATLPAPPKPLWQNWSYLSEYCGLHYGALVLGLAGVTWANGSFLACFSPQDTFLALLETNCHEPRSQLVHRGCLWAARDNSIRSMDPQPQG
jgi:hypothetical protein